MLILLLVAFSSGPSADELARGLGRIETLLDQWRFAEAKDEAEKLIEQRPDEPAALLEAAWVKHHFSEHQSAGRLAERAASASLVPPAWEKRLEMIRQAAELFSKMTRRESPGGQVVVFFRPGPEEILVEPLFDTVERTLRVVGEDLGHQAETPVRVEVLPDDQALSALTGLEVEAIRTSHTIAVCKFGRLLVTSPAATLTGYGWADTASHELVHMIISQKTRNHTPIWLHEALARFEDTRWRSDEPLYRGGLLPLSASRLARALRENKLITFEQMHPSMALLPSADAAELAFAEVYTVTDFMRQRWGYEGIRRVLDAIAGGADDMSAIAGVTGLERQKFVRAWLKWLKGQKLRELSGGYKSKFEQMILGLPGDGDPSRPLEPRQPGMGDHFHLGELLRARGRLAASVVEYRGALQLAGPFHATGWLLAEKLGIALFDLGRKEASSEALEKSLELNPAGLEAHLRLGTLLLDSDPRGAWLHAREAERINPLDPRVQRLALKAAEELAKVEPAFSAEAARHRRALELLGGN